MSFDASFSTVQGAWNGPTPDLIVHRAFGEYLVVPDGERFVSWDRYGLATWIDGPSSELMFGGHSRSCLKYVAGPGQFIVVTRKTGEREIIEGPVALWEDPVKSVCAQVFAAMEISTNEAVVVYAPTGDKIARKIVYGPMLYIPTNAQEWQHEFVWHGTNQHVLESKGLNRKTMGGLRFTKLRMVPDQLYYDVENVRTKDDALLTVKTMVFFQLSDVSKMIEATHDPISDLINSISADVIANVSTLSFEEFRANANNLNDLLFYPTLVAAGAKLGYEISKIVFRGYEASQKLQLMHDEAIEQRTRLILTTESEEQLQGLEDLRQHKSHQRSLTDREEEERAKQHNLKIEEMAHAAKLSVNRLNAEQEQALTQLSTSSEFAKDEKRMRAREGHLKTLKEMGVDLDRFLSQKADRVIRLDGNVGAIPHFHLEAESKL